GDPDLARVVVDARAGEGDVVRDGRVVDRERARVEDPAAQAVRDVVLDRDVVERRRPDVEETGAGDADVPLDVTGEPVLEREALERRGRALLDLEHAVGRVL